LEGRGFGCRFFRNFMGLWRWGMDWDIQKVCNNETVIPFSGSDTSQRMSKDRCKDSEDREEQKNKEREERKNRNNEIISQINLQIEQINQKVNIQDYYRYFNN
jgi:hypothetical protein